MYKADEEDDDNEERQHAIGIVPCQNRFPDSCLLYLQLLQLPCHMTTQTGTGAPGYLDIHISWWNSGTGAHKIVLETLK